MGRGAAGQNGEQALADDVQADRAYGVMNDVLSTVHGQLQFAEAKNGALLAVNLAVVVGIATIFDDMKELPLAVIVCLSMVMVGLAIAAFTALWSFLPVHGVARHQYSKGTEGGGANLFYWGEIARFTPKHYAEELLKALGIAEPPSRIELDLADQIVINAGIAERKFKVFNTAALITIVTAAVSVVVFVFLFAGAGGKLG
jgi:hypothetical protein